MTKVVYIASPYRAADAVTRGRNMAYARAATRFAFGRGAVPFTPHLLYTRVLDDADPRERTMGIGAGLALMRKCDELWVFAQRGISEGMRAEIDEAKRLGLRILVMGLPGYDRATETSPW